MGVNNNTESKMINFHDFHNEEIEISMLEERVKSRLKNTAYCDQTIEITTVGLNFLTKREGVVGEIDLDTNLQFEKARKITISVSLSHLSKELLKAYFSQVINLDRKETYFPEHLNNRISNIFSDAIVSQEFESAIESAFLSCKTIVWYSSLESKRTALSIEKNSLIEGSYNAGQITNRGLVVAGGIASLALIFIRMISLVAPR